jgi:hypothetical protein
MRERREGIRSQNLWMDLKIRGGKEANTRSVTIPSSELYTTTMNTYLETVRKSERKEALKERIWPEETGAALAPIPRWTG